MKFEWDENKRLKNIQKHRIDFKDILDIFNRPMLERVDDRQDYGEERIICLGLSHLVENPTVVVVVYVEKINDIIRIISARKALRPMIKINSPIWLAFLTFFFVAPLGTYFNMLPSERLE